MSNLVKNAVWRADTLFNCELIITTILNEMRGSTLGIRTEEEETIAVLKADIKRKDKEVEAIY